MSKQVRLFCSPAIEAQYAAAYQAVMQRWPVPYEDLYIPTRFGATHVIASGPPDAAPLVLLASSGAAAPQWFLNVGPLSHCFRTYAVDLIGEVNRSVPVRPVCSTLEFADWAGDLFDGLQVESTHMVGNSYGGFLTFNTALHLPERVRKAVLISPAATFVQMWAWYWHLFIPAHVIAPAIRSERLVTAAYAWLWGNFPMDERYGRLRAITKLAGYPRYGVSQNRVLPPVYSDEELRRIRTPMLLLVGDNEVIYRPDRVLRRATRLVPGLKAEIVPRANHTAQLTAPKVVNERIMSFLLD